MKKYCTLLLAFILLSPYGYLKSQISLTLPSFVTCPGEFDIPVEATSFNEVASVSMKIKFDTLILAYDGHTDLNPGFSGGVFLINSVHGEVIFSWFSLTPINLGNANLLTLHFHHLVNASTSIAWNDDSLGNCVLTDLNGTELPTTLIDASLTSSFIQPLPLTPANNATNVNETPLFHWNGSGCGPHYQLIYSSDPGFSSDTIHITNIFGTSFTADSLEYNTTYYWKVKATINDTPFDTDWSETFSFSTKDANGINELWQYPYHCKLFPNPAANQTSVHIEVNNKVNLHITIFDMSGNEIQKVVPGELGPGSYIYELNTKNYQPGNYIVRILNVFQGESSIKSVKFSILE
jgi:hypothetical protein